MLISAISFTMWVKSIEGKKLSIITSSLNPQAEVYFYIQIWSYILGIFLLIVAAVQTLKHYNRTNNWIKRLKKRFKVMDE